MPEYEWEDEYEKGVVLRKMQTECIVSSHDRFTKILMGKGIIDVDTRYVVWAAPSRYSFDANDGEGVSGPLEAIQAAIELHVNGGWDWLVWDQKADVGFSIDANTYIYAPMEAHFAERYSPENFDKRSTEDLRTIIYAAQSVIKQRGE